MTDKNEILKNFSLTFLANIVSIISSILITLLLPKFINITNYSYYQLYIFYVSYIGFLCFGWNDGVYLKLGGKYYNEIDKDLYSSQWRFFSFIETMIGILIIIFGLLFISNEKKYIVIMVGFCIIIYLPRAFIDKIFQATFRIKEYALGLIIEKIVQIIITLLFLLFKKVSFHWYVIAALTGRFFSTVYIVYVSRDLIFRHLRDDLHIKHEIKTNISRGIKLMCSNVASLLIIGVVRQGVEIKWDIKTFGKMSLAFSLTNFFLIFIQSISTILFPLLRRIKKGKLSDIYSTLDTILMVSVLFLLLFYYPFRLLIAFWLPNYQDSLIYLDILFPVFVFQSKFSMLIVTYLKTLNREGELLFINLISVFISILSTLITIFVFNNLLYALVGIIFVLNLRCILGEIKIKKYLQIDIYKNIILEFVLIFIFIISNVFLHSWKSSICYLLFFCFYIFFNKKEIIKAIDVLKMQYLLSQSKHQSE